MLPPDAHGTVTVIKDQTVYGVIKNSVEGALIWMPFVAAGELRQLAKVTVDSLSFVFPPGTYMPTTTQSVQVSPDLQDNFVLGRAVSGKIALKSDTTSTTSAAMSGELHAVALTDIRGFRQLDVARLVQQTVTKKDAVWNVGCADGVITVLGPDISADFVPTNTDAQRRTGGGGYSGKWYTHDAPQRTIITPVGLLAGTGSFAGAVSIMTDDIPWFSHLDFLISGGPNEGTLHGLHIYCTVNDTGACTFYTPNFQIHVDAYGPNFVSAQRGDYPQEIPAHAYYVGTLFEPTSFPIQIQPIAADLYTLGSTGPTRLLVWQNMAAGQNIQVSGIINSELIVTSDIAPYLSSIGEGGPINASILPYVHAIYNGPSNIYKRVYSGPEYLVAIKQHSGAEGPSEETRTPGASAEATAAGLFSNLGSQIGGMLGPIGQLGGGVLGSVADAFIPTAAGSFKRYRQEPLAAGSFRYN